jgi:hypothetical protein
MHVCNPSTQEVETRELQVLSQTGLQSDPDSRRPKKEREGREGGRKCHMKQILFCTINIH